MSGARFFCVMSLALLAAGCPGGNGSSAVVRFRVESKNAKAVALWDREKDLALRVEGKEVVELEAPREKLHAPRVTIESEDGSETTSAKLEISAVTTTVVVGPLRIWPATVGVQRMGDRLRFSWPALTGPDAPESIRYSLLFTYRNAQDHEFEGTLIVPDKCEAIQSLNDLSEIFPDRDASVKVMTMRIRAYSAGGPEGPIWAGPKQEWPVPADLPLPQPTEKDKK
jgi:hypothetical protein